MDTTRPDTSQKPGSRPRKFETLLFIALGVPTLYVAYYAGRYIFLVHLYGFSRVRSEHLHFTATPKGRAWLVSNGDSIAEGHFLHFLISLGLFLVLFFVIYAFLHKLLPERKESDARVGV